MLGLDAKRALDADALDRPVDIAALRAPAGEDEKEVEAFQYRLNSIARIRGEPELNEIAAADLDDAAQKIVAAVREAR